MHLGKMTHFSVFGKIGITGINLGILESSQDSKDSRITSMKIQSCRPLTKSILCGRSECNLQSLAQISWNIQHLQVLILGRTLINYITSLIVIGVVKC